MLALAAACSRGQAADTAAPTAVTESPPATRAPDAAPTADFATVSKLMNDAIAAQRLPGAVVVIGHGGKVVFHHAYGSRKLAGEPGLDGSPAPAEPMTEDTIFDMASLTKGLATATTVMQLYEQGKVAFDDPVQTYLPDFNTANDPQRAKVTVRMLLTQTSGEPIDVSLQDPWGVDGADKTEGFHRALSTPLQSGPGAVFRYSDINYILLGALLEKVSGEAEDVYVRRNVFAPLGMEETRYLPPAKACGPHTMRGAAIAWAPAPKGSAPVVCPAGTWSTSLVPRIAPTARDEESGADPSKNPDLGYLLREGQNLFGFGWDIDTAYSAPRGVIFPIGSFGETGFTGTSLWLDPGSDTYVILLANSIHLRGSPPISDLRGDVATAAAQALGL